MKNAFTTTVVAVTLGLTAAGAFAADSSVRARSNVWETSGYYQAPTTSTVSRADVKGEVVAAVQARAGLSIKETSSHFPKATPSVLSRAEVKAELQHARTTGSVDYRG
jgi:hypothetical protein